MGREENPEIESSISRFKIEDWSLLLDSQNLHDLQSLVSERMGCHTEEQRHSTIGNRAPATYVATLSHDRSITIPDALRVSKK